MNGLLNHVAFLIAQIFDTSLYVHAFHIYVPGDVCSQFFVVELLARLYFDAF